MEVSSKSDRKFDRQNPAQGVPDSFSLSPKKNQAMTYFGHPRVPKVFLAFSKAPSSTARPLLECDADQRYTYRVSFKLG
jgi:hypothetical protein